MAIYLFVCLFIYVVFRDRASQYVTLAYPGTFSVDQAGLELRDLPLPGECWD